jgi:lipoprotein-anchoring transpeptidase ErfK/SrfK
VERLFFHALHSSSRRWLRFFLLAFAAGASVTLIDAAAARSRRHSSEVPEKKQKAKAEEPAPPSGPMFFVISLGRQHVSVYSNGGLYARAPVSTGRPGHPTPMGLFTIIGKERLHHSNIYSGAPMPYMQRITWSGVAMHEGVLPGYPASHGCIRMPHEFAQRIFGLTQGNERVIVTREDIAPAPFSHARLPVPALLPEPGPEREASISVRILQNALSSGGASQTSGAEKVSVKADGSEARPEGEARKLLNPHDFAVAMKAKAAKNAQEAAAAANPARIAISAKAKEMQAASVDLRKAMVALINAKDRLEGVERQLQKASGDEAVNAANTAKAEAEAKVKEAEAQVETVKRAKAQKDDEWGAALQAYKDLDGVQRAAAEGVKFWNRRLSPVSIFISRKTQRLYVRQNNAKVFDVPVAIRDPEKPFGTHLYMAMPPEKGSGADPARLRWLVLTLPESSLDTDRPRRRHSQYYDLDDEDAPRTPAPAVSASAALDRIEVPADVAEKISQMVWAGGSIIVSDSGISRETDDDTDFIILTR